MITSKSPNSPRAELDLEMFMAAAPRRKVQDTRPNRLNPHAAELLNLLIAGFSLFRMQEFLLLNRIEISRAGISKYLAKRQRIDIPGLSTSTPKGKS